MSRDIDYEPEKYTCSCCQYFNTPCQERTCKRIDNKHPRLDYSKPWFACIREGKQVCRDFKLKEYMKYANRNWIDFDTYWSEYVENWLPYKNTDILVWFVLDEDDSIRYGVKLMDFVNGSMYDESGNLKAVEKMYLKRDRESPTGYKMIHEKLKTGVEI